MLSVLIGFFLFRLQVAVTGLPEPQPRHAVIMALFAGECKIKMNELVASLESSLGPDTGELS